MYRRARWRLRGTPILAVKLLRASWLLGVGPLGQAGIADGTVAIEDTLITAIGTWQDISRQFRDAELVDLRNHLIIPGMVNAHTHLELSGLRNQVPYRGDFTDWIARLVTARQSIANDFEQAIRMGCSESLAGGVTTLGDIRSMPVAWPGLLSQTIRKTCFLEIVGLNTTLQQCRQDIQQQIKQTTRKPIPHDTLLRIGLSPHSPCTTRRDYYELAGQLAASYDLTITTHLAETTAEVDFLKHGKGRWHDFLKDRNLLEDTWQCPHIKPMHYFLDIDLSNRRALLAHVNYIDNDELAALAASNHSVAYCPRSHAFFQHDDHPFRRMLDLGINVCLGTDSLASNTTLSILDEMRFLHRRYPDFPVDTLLKMATINGSIALGWDDITGTIQPGKAADLVAIPLTKPHSNRATQQNVLLDVLRSDYQPYMTIVEGQFVLSQRERKRQKHRPP